jgi:short-subunit dehydrogenase/uncharacterized protein YbjT (DUF2867 family)/SAM-dependent methyltransferase
MQRFLPSRRDMARRLLAQAFGYSRSGVGLGGSLLKHSLYPVGLLAKILPASGTVADLGCGEGMLANLLARNLVGARFHGIDTNASKIELAKQNAPRNASFACQDINEWESPPVAAVIFNDVLHHRDDAEQGRMLAKAFAMLEDDGTLILKEVDARDGFDLFWTRLWDRRLYAEDTLNFHTRDEWERALGQAGFRLLAIHRVKHPWPASRTVFVATKRPRHTSRPVHHSRSSAPPLRVLVTGGTGFVGQHLIRELLQRDCLNGDPIEVTAIVRDPCSMPRDWQDEGTALRVLRHDLTHSASDLVPGEFDYIFHLAANVDFFATQGSAQENVTATKNLLRVAASPRLKRFVFASTVGAVDRSPRDDCSLPLDEHSPACPVSKYGRSKLESEVAVRNSGVPYTIVRLPWCYGPGMASSHHVRSLMERSLRRGLLLKIDWPGRVSVVEVRDLARLLCNIVTVPSTLNETYFASDGRPISFGELFRAMGQIGSRKRGHLRIPAFVVGLCRRLRRFLPFQLKCLLFDALTVSSAKLTAALSGEPPPRSDGFLLPLARDLHQETYPGRTRCRVVITGAASGIGRALAVRCYVAGYQLLLVDRDERTLRELGAALQADVQFVDLSLPEHVAALAARIAEGDECPDILINNAAIGLRNEFVAMESRELNVLLGVNCMAPMTLMNAFLRECVRRGNGTLINIGSSAGLQPLPYMAAYSASKAFLVNLSEAVTGELMAHADSSAVEVLTVIPSGTATNFQVAAGVKRSPREKLLEPSTVAALVIDQVGRGSKTIFIGSTARMMAAAARVLPRRWQPWLWEHMMRTMR